MRMIPVRPKKDNVYSIKNYKKIKNQEVIVSYLAIILSLIALLKSFHVL